jgi:TolB-like protein/DNA-binding winged helix-turn-helix (wHTH) protein
MTTDHGFEIADWHVDPQTCQIRQGDEIVKLEPKVMELLVYMAEHPSEVLSRDVLLDNVWPGVVVGYEALTNAVIKLRKAFGDDAHNPFVIETFSKKGYRLIAMVKQVEPVQGDDAIRSTKDQPALRFLLSLRLKAFFALSIIIIGSLIVWLVKDNYDIHIPQQIANGLVLPGKPSIAVLPFVNTGNKAEYSYFSDGITDDLITGLSEISGLFVISRNSTFQYKGRSVDTRQVARALGVRYILEGSVRRSGEQVRINTQLVDGTTGAQLWAERYDSNLQSVFELQDQVTRMIIDALAMRLGEKDRFGTSSPETSNPEAYDEFLKGWERHWRASREDFAQAEAHFRKALQLDPGYSRAHAALALIYWQAWQQGWHQNVGVWYAGWARARRELEGAMVNPTPLVLSLRSSMQLYNLRFDEAISEARQAVSLNQNSATGYLALAEALGYAGRSTEAIEAVNKALRLDPNFPAPYLSVLGRVKFDQGQFQDAANTLERAILINPRDESSIIFLIAAFGHLSEQNKGLALIKQINNHYENEKVRALSIDWMKNRWPYRNKADRERLIEGLKKAGIPDW